MKKKRGTFGAVFSYAAECKGKLALAVILAILSVGCGVLPYIAVYKIINLFFESQASMQTVMPWVGVCAAGYTAQRILFSFATYSSHMAAYNILEHIRNLLTEKLVRMPLGTVMGKTAGEWKSTIVDRVESMELPLAHMIPEGISNLVLPVFVIAYLFSINWKIALAAMICVPVGAAVYAMMMKNFNSQYENYMKSSNYVNSVMVEYTEGIEVIKAFNQSSSSYKKYSSAVEDFKNYTLDWYKSTWGLMNLGGAILPSTLLGVLPAGVLLYVSGGFTPAELTLAVILSLSIVAPVSWFTTAVNQFKQVQYAVRDVETVLSLPELPQAEKEAEIKGSEVQLKNVHFAYTEDGEKVLHGINLTLPQKKFTALVGPSGGGKSTVAKLIARFWDVNEGTITVGGADIRNIPLKQLSQQISYVAQDNFLFNCSLFENIRIGKPDATDEEVMEAAKAAQCEEFISRLPQGWETPAGEAGGKLSGGERQRIAIARAILKNAPIVVLDEATAFTDPENEAQLQKSITELTAGKTLLVIAHRLSTIQNADKIVVLEKGEIVAEGGHSELLERSPIYKNMWNAHIGARAWQAGTQGKEQRADV